MPESRKPPLPSDAVRAHIWVRGRVQGVGYRMYVEFEAERRNLNGWVRNCDSSKVECVFEGQRADVEAVIAWCRKGPPHALVLTVHTDWETPTGEDSGFRIRHSV